MADKIIATNGTYDLSNINNMKDLKEEIEFLKSAITKEEEDFEKHLRKLPHYLIKSTADNILPSFLNKMIANGTWKVLLSSITMFANPFSKGFSFKKNILGSAKKLGLITLLKSAYTVWSNKRVAKPKAVTQISRPVINSLKTKNFKKD